MLHLAEGGLVAVAPPAGLGTAPLLLLLLLLYSASSSASLLPARRKSGHFDTMGCVPLDSHPLRMRQKHFVVARIGAVLACWRAWPGPACGRVHSTRCCSRRLLRELLLPAFDGLTRPAAAQPRGPRRAGRNKTNGWRLN